MSVDFQFFILITVPVKNQITSWATAQSEIVSHLCSPLLHALLRKCSLAK